MGWDEAREQILANQKELGIVPENTNLSERIDQIPAWETLNADEKKLYAKQMEVFAAQMEHVDHQIGRVVQTLKRIGEKLANSAFVKVHRSYIINLAKISNIADTSLKRRDVNN